MQSKACCFVLIDIRFRFSLDGFHDMCMTRAIIVTHTKSVPVNSRESKQFCLDQCGCVYLRAFESMCLGVVRTAIEM